MWSCGGPCPRAAHRRAASGPSPGWPAGRAEHRVTGRGGGCLKGSPGPWISNGHSWQRWQGQNPLTEGPSVEGNVVVCGGGCWVRMGPETKPQIGHGTQCPFPDCPRGAAFGVPRGRGPAAQPARPLPRSPVPVSGDVGGDLFGNRCGTACARCGGSVANRKAHFRQGASHLPPRRSRPTAEIATERTRGA